jgi:uncharacterized protein YidB (DUF937 family)
MFDSLIDETATRFGVGDKAGTLLSALLTAITDSSQGGFGGFLDKFRAAGLGPAVDSWISTQPNQPIVHEDVVNAIGSHATTRIARQAGVAPETAGSALAFMIPFVVDNLTHGGIVPGEDTLLSSIGGHLSGVAAEPTVDRFGSAAAETFADSQVSNLADSVPDNSPLKWLAPLLLLAISMVMGWAFCSKPPEPSAGAPAKTAVNSNVNTAQ